MGQARRQSEFAGAPIRDKRLQRRLEVIGDAVAVDPQATFPDAAGSDGELEGLYRFLNNPRVAPTAIVQPHIEATARRAAERTIAVVHDTTAFTFKGAPGECLGFIPTTTQRGFWGHFALAVGDEGEALGVLGTETIFFEQRTRGVIRRNRSAAAKMYAKRIDKASLRWDRMVETVRARLPTSCGAIHVMDREADNYRLFAAMISSGERFVVRVRHERRPARLTDDEAWESLEEVAKSGNYSCERDVLLSRRRRRAGLNATHGSRDARTARLRVTATPAVIKKPRGIAATPSSLALNLVRVHELDAPEGTEPVEWLLLTTESIDGQPDVERVIDWYRRRWVIEEFFRALKTGCAYERRQFESRAAILRTLSLLTPIAWQLLQLRDEARRQPARPARTVLRASQLAVLRALSKAKLHKAPSVQEALLAVAAQGGHLRRNGAPGWQTLGRGLEKIWWAELGYLAAIQEQATK